MTGEAAEAPVRQELPPRVVLARRFEFSLIALGGVFLIFGWGIGHQEWARAVGWLCTGIGFAIEMVYGKVVRAARVQAEPQPETKPEAQPETVSEKPATDDSTP